VYAAMAPFARRMIGRIGSKARQAYRGVKSAYRFGQRVARGVKPVISYFGKSFKGSSSRGRGSRSRTRLGNPRSPSVRRRLSSGKRTRVLPLRRRHHRRR